MNTLTLIAAQINPNSGDKFLLVQWYDQDGHLQQTIKTYDDCNQTEKDFIDNSISFGTAYLP